MTKKRGYVGLWWQALTRPAAAGRLVLDREGPRGFNVFLLAVIMLLYGIYGLTMGSFAGSYPAAVSAIKMPFLYIMTLLVCLTPFYAANSLVGLQLHGGQCLRLLLLLLSANALAVVSYAPVSYFFAVTTSNEGYAFLFLMHVNVLAFAGLASIVANVMIVRATANALGRTIRPSLLLGWAALYGVVGVQTAWTLRPWISKPSLEYVPIRPIGGSFIEAIFEHVQTYAGS